MNNDFDMVTNFRILRCPKCGIGGWQRDRKGRLQVAYVSPQKTKNGYLTKILCLKCSTVFEVYQNPNSKIYNFLNTPKGHIPEHHFVWEQTHGDIPSNHAIHHLNAIKNDNRLENLAAIPRSRHNSLLGNNSQGNVWILVKELQARIRELESKVIK